MGTETAMWSLLLPLPPPLPLPGSLAVVAAGGDDEGEGGDASLLPPLWHCLPSAACAPWKEPLPVPPAPAARPWSASKHGTCTVVRR